MDDFIEKDKLICSKFYINSRINGNLLRTKIKNQDDPDIIYLKGRFTDSDSIKETLYRIVYNILEKPKCPICGKPLKLGLHGFQKHCSMKCAHANPETVEKYKETCRKNFGVDFSMQSAIVQEKSRKTNIEKYGVEYAAQSKEVMKKIDDTNFKRYGMRRATKCDKTQEKYRATCHKRYGADYALQSEEVKAKGSKTTMKKYGTDWPSKAESVKRKIEKTNIGKYGVKYAPQAEEVKEKIKCTNLKRYGVENPSQAESVKKKKCETFIKHYGVPYLMQSPIMREQYFKTKQKNGTVNTSKFEEAAYKILLEKYPDVIRQYKSDKYPFHCDFYLPSMDLYIEMNYSWTHGRHPFDPLSESDAETLSIWREKAKVSDYYANAVDVWTTRDPKKLAAAKNAGLNYMAIYRGFDIARLIEAIRENFTMGKQETTVILA